MVESGAWEGETVKIKALWEWCELRDEFDYWTGSETPALWEAMKEKKGEDPHNRETVKSFKQFLTRKATGGEGGGEATIEKAKPKKKAAAQETAEEIQIRIGIEAEDRLKAALANTRDLRTAAWDDAVFAPIVTILGGNAIALAAWNLIVAHYKSGSSKDMVSGLPTKSHAELTTAYATWRRASLKLEQLGRLGAVTRMSKFTEVKDKSQRADGGQNAANLVKRAYQASFLVDIEGFGEINLHVDSEPPVGG